MNPSLPVSRVVSVSVQLTPAGAQVQSLSNMLLLGPTGVIDTTERYRNYLTAAAVAADFGTSAPEYLAAIAWFAQAPQPTTLTIGRWCQTAAAGGLRGATLSAAQQALANFTAITTPAFKMAINGGAVTNFLPGSFAGAANLNAVAAIIQATTGISGVVNVVWNALYSRFEFTSTTTGATSNVSLLTAGTGGTDVSSLLGGTASNSGAYVYAGQVAETAATAVALFDNMIGQQWYGLNMPTAVDADHLAVAAYIETAGTSANAHTYWLTTAEAAVLVASSTSDIAYQLQQFGYNRTFTQFSSSNPNAAMSAAARILGVNYLGSLTAITLKFKLEPGVIAETLTASQVTALENKNCNVFVNYNNGTAILEQGVQASGNFTDIVTGTDWLALSIQAAIYNVLYTSTTKIPQTDGGMQMLTTAAEAICIQGVANGLLAPGTWNSTGFGQLTSGAFMPKGYYIYAPSVNTQIQANRSARMAVPIQIAAKLAGAIHSSSVAITVNQ